MPERYWLFDWFLDHMREVSIVVVSIGAIAKVFFDIDSLKAWRKEVNKKNTVATVENIVDWKNKLEKTGIVTKDACGPLQRNCQDIIAERLLKGDAILTERLDQINTLYRLNREDMADLRTQMSQNTEKHNEDFGRLSEVLSQNIVRQDEFLKIMATAMKLRSDDLPARNLQHDKDCQL